MKRTWKQIGSLFLAFCMVFTMLPTMAFAETGEVDSGVPLGVSRSITSFVPLDEDVAEQTVETGTPEEELNLPGALSVTVTESVYNIASGSDASEKTIETTVPVSEWTADQKYDGDTIGVYTFTPMLTLPDGLTVTEGVYAPQITVTVEEITAPQARGGISPMGGSTVTGSLSIGGTVAVSDLTANGNGTSGGVIWVWNAAAATLTLTDDGTIGGDGKIVFATAGDVTVMVNGTVTATALHHNFYTAGKLTINGSGTLNLSTTESDQYSIFADGGIEIADLTVNVYKEGKDASAVYTYNGDFTMNSGALNLYSAASQGIASGKDILIGGTASIKTNPSCAKSALTGGYNIVISGGNVDITSTEENAIRSMIYGGTGVTVSGGTLTTGEDCKNGSILSHLTVNNAAAKVTINGDIGNDANLRNLTVSAGTVTVTGAVSGNINVTGGTVSLKLFVIDSPAYDIPESMVGTAIADINLYPAVKGGTAPFIFSAAGLPEGITINEATGIISGTPAAVTNAGTATITVTDGATPTAGTESITIAYGEVIPAPVPNGYCGAPGTNGGKDVTWNLDIDTGVLTISGTGNMAGYDDTSNLAPWYLHYKDDITAVVIESGVTNIGRYAFCRCPNISSVIIPSGVTTIGVNAFYGCVKLGNVTIPFGVTIIGAGAFGGCQELAKVTIPSSVTTIGSGVFKGCTKLAGITIPDGVTSIGEDTFRDCTSLSSVTIPDGVTSIGNYAFRGCKALSSIIIPDKVTTIGYGAFSDCTKITSIIIPASVTSIDYYAFSRCTNLASVTFMGTTPPTICNNAFENVAAAGTVTYPATAAEAYKTALASTNIFDWIPIEGNCGTNVNWSLNKSTGILTISGTGAMADYADVTSMPWLSYAYADIKEIVIESGVTHIGDYAFRACAALSSVTIPDSVTTIGKYAFEQCRLLPNITIPDTVTAMGDYSFSSCEMLDSVTIPRGISTIGTYVFNNCINLSSVTIPSGVTSIGNYAFRKCEALSSVTIPDSVTSIGEGAFSECSKLTSIVISAKVTSIGKGAFFGCTNLTGITIPDSVTTIGNQAFSNCTGLSSITIGNSMNVIDGYAFRDCTNLVSVTFMGMTPPTIGADAFNNVASGGTVSYPLSAASTYASILAATGLKNWTPYTISNDTVTIKEEEKISDIKVAIETALGMNSTVTVTGTKTGVTETLTLAIPAEKTLVWKAKYENEPGKSITLLKMIGEGIFIVEEGGEITATQTNGSAVSGNKVVVTGGTVKAEGQYCHAIYTSVGAKVTGGTVSASGTNARTIGSNNPSIEQNTLQIEIDGGTVQAVGGATGIVTQGLSDGNKTLIKVTGGIIDVKGTGKAIHIYNKGSIEITGGEIHTESGEGIYTASDITLENVTFSAIEGNAVDAGAVTVKGTSVITSASGYALKGNGNVRVEGNSVISTDTGTAIYLMTTGYTTTVCGNATVKATGDNGTAISHVGELIISGGVVSATTGKAASNINTAHTVTVSGGAVFAYGSAINDVIGSSAFSAPSGTGVVIAWNQEAGSAAYIINNTDDIFKAPDSVTAKWARNGSDSGILYENGANTGFIVLPVTVTDGSVTNAETPSITSQPAGATYTQGDSAAPLSMTASVADGGILSYQWYSNTSDSTTGGTPVGTNSSTYTPSTATAGTAYYYCMVTNTNNSVSGGKTAAATSNIAAIVVNPPSLYTISGTIKGSDTNTGISGADVVLNNASGGEIAHTTTNVAGQYSFANIPADSYSLEATATGYNSGTIATFEVSDASVTKDLTLTKIGGTTTYAVTVNGSYASPTGAGSYAKDTTVNIYAGNRSNYTFTGWTSSDVTIINASSKNASFVMPGKTVTVTAGWSYNGGGGSSSGGGGGGSYIPPIAATPTAPPNQPVTATTLVTATAGVNGTANADIPANTITDAIAKAQADAKAQGNTANDISVELNVTMPQGSTSLTATIPQSALQSLVTAGVNQFTVNGAPVSLGLNQSALQTIQRQASSGITISMTPATGLSAPAQSMIGNRPVYNITISYTDKDGKTQNITSFGSGTATLAIPYTPGRNEAAGYLFGVYVDGNGNASRIPGSVYDANSRSILIPTNHLSVYGVGYTAPSAKFIDVANHWAKESIDYVVGRGLLSGTSETTFAPNTAMTRGMLVTALGRLAGVDVKTYTTNSFTDVKADSAFRPYIEWAYKKGVVQGIGNQQFAPDRAITREEIAVICANYAKATSYTLPVTRKAIAYADVSSIGSVYNTAVTAMQQAGIMIGGTDNRFNPKSNATRAEVSSMLHHYIKLTIDPATAQGWAKNDDGQYMYYKDSKPLTGWQPIDGVKYFFNTDGTLQTGWVKDGGNWRYYSGNKAAVGWVDISEKRYYFAKEGLMIAGKWLEIDGKWYYFNADGSLAKNTKIDGYEVDENGVRKNK